MNTQLLTAAFTAAVPTLMVILGVILTRSDYHQLRSELRNEITSSHSDLRKKIAELRAQQHADMLRIYELFGGHGQRLARLETQVYGR